jgi:hypothetical protein
MSQPPAVVVTGDWPEVAIRWPGPDGPWLITTHWATMDGRLAIVGLDVRSYHEGQPVGDRLAEVTQPVLRGISITKIREHAREILIRSHPSPLLFRPIPPDGVGPDILKDPDAAEAIAGWLDERLSLLTAKGEPRKRRPPAGEELLRHVAALYAYADGSGDKAPAKYVADQLREAGEPRLSTQGGRVLVRQWIRRARERGYLPPNGERSDQATTPASR